MKNGQQRGKTARAPQQPVRRSPIRYSKSAASKPYALREPTTGLYAVLGDPAMREAARLDYLSNATRFRTSADALIAARACGVADQPHEIERVDA